MSTTLHSLLTAGQAHDAEYGKALANHQPMALVALARLGADDAHLKRYAKHYAKAVGLLPARAAKSWPLGDEWRPRLGQPKAWPLYRDLFRQWLAHDGSADMLVQILPWLMPGCGASAFHGLIRTAYGLEAGHAGEVADGVAYWACRYLPLGDLPTADAGAAPAAPAATGRRAARASAPPPPVLDPAALLRRLAASDSKAGLIAQRMADAAQSGAVNRAIAPLVIDPQTPERLARAAAFAYAQTGSFTALHLVTATHAMRVVAHRLANDSDAFLAAWRHFWQAYAHGVVAARLRVAAQPLQLRAWSEIVPLALASTNEHVIKLVDSCREEARHYTASASTTAPALANFENADPALVWRQAASRAVQAAA
jgi:Questin oxidase-like